jgi:hypothetical protein
MMELFPKGKTAMEEMAELLKNASTSREAPIAYEELMKEMEQWETTDPIFDPIQGPKGSPWIQTTTTATNPLTKQMTTLPMRMTEMIMPGMTLTNQTMKCPTMTLTNQTMKCPTMTLALGNQGSFIGATMT